MFYYAKEIKHEFMLYTKFRVLMSNVAVHIPSKNHTFLKPSSYLSTASFNVQQDRPCAYKVTLSRVRTAIVVMEKQYVLRILGVCL
jgi:ubiquinone biosynthesis protein COQ9